MDFVTLLLTLLSFIAPNYGAGIQQLSPWKVDGGNVELASTTAHLRIPDLVDCDTIDTNGFGVLSCGTDGGGGGGSDWATTSANYYNSQFRDWHISGGLLVPTTTLSINAPSIFSIQSWTVSTSTAVCAVGCEFTNIQTAIDAGWNDIVLKAETYTLSAPITIPRNNISIRGVSKATQINFNAATVPVAVISSNVVQQRTGIRLSNLFFNQTGTEGTGTCIDYSTWASSKNFGIDCTGANIGLIASTTGSYYNDWHGSTLSVSGAGARGFSVSGSAIDNTLAQSKILCGDTSVIGVYVDAHAAHLNNVTVETDCAVGFDIEDEGHDADLEEIYSEGNAINVRLASGVEGVKISGSINDADDTATGNILDLGSRGTTIDARIQSEPVKAYIPGTTNPVAFTIGATTTSETGAHLTIADTISTSQYSVLLQNNGAFAGGDHRVGWRNTSSNRNYIHGYIGSFVGSGFNNNYVAIGAATSSNHAATEVVRFGGLGGNVGISTTTPGSRLSIQGDQFIAGKIVSTSTLPSIFPYASSTYASFDTASTSALVIAPLTSALLVTNSSGAVAEYGGAAACTNQFVTAISALGASTCASINNAQWSGTDLSVANGGTGLSTFGGSNTVLYTTAADTLASEAAFLYDQSLNKLTLGFASTTMLQSVTASTTDLVIDGSIRLPHGSAPSLTSLGRLAIDTDNGGNIVYATTTNPIATPVVLAGATSTLAWFVMGSTSPDLISGGIQDVEAHWLDTVVTGVICHVDAGTSVVVNISNSAGSSDSNAVTCGTNSTQFTFTSNNVFTAYNRWRVELGTVTGAVDYLHLRFVGYRKP